MKSTIDKSILFELQMFISKVQLWLFMWVLFSTNTLKSWCLHKEAGGYKLLAAEKPPNCSFIGQKLFVVKKKAENQPLFSNWTPQKSLLKV